MFLNAEDLATLTGYTKPSAQARWLESNGFTFVIGGDRKPKVLRTVVIGRLGGKSCKLTKEPKLRL